MVIHSFICKRGGWKVLSMITKFDCEWRGRQPGNHKDLDLPIQRPSLVPSQLCDLERSHRLFHFKFLICLDLRSSILATTGFLLLSSHLSMNHLFL